MDSERTLSEPEWVHHAAKEGYSTGADTYVQGRPGYPVACLDWLKTTLNLTAVTKVLEVGAGTGKFTALLLETGADIIALEPVNAMREKLATNCPEATVITGVAQSIPLPDHSVDVLVCAQSFHWFASPETLKEFHRVLKSKGQLALIWNIREASIPWVRQFDQLINQYEGDSPRFHTRQWQTLFPCQNFAALKEMNFPNPHTGTHQEVIINRALSTSFIAALPQSEQTAFTKKLWSLIDEEQALMGNPVVSVPYTTFVYTSQTL